MFSQMNNFRTRMELGMSFGLYIIKDSVGIETDKKGALS